MIVHVTLFCFLPSFIQTYAHHSTCVLRFISWRVVRKQQMIRHHCRLRVTSALETITPVRCCRRHFLSGSSVINACASTGAASFLELQQLCGVSAVPMLMLCGAAARLLTLLFSLWGDRAIARMALAAPELKGAYNEYSLVRTDRSSSELRIYKAACAYQVKKKEIFGRHRTSFLQCFSSVAALPIVASSLSAVSALCTDSEFCYSVSSSLLLAHPAATAILLPFVCSSLTVINFELSLSPSVKEDKLVQRAVVLCRLALFPATAVLASCHSAVCLFFLGMNSVGFAQAMLLRRPGVRSRLGFPPF